MVGQSGSRSNLRKRPSKRSLRPVSSNVPPVPKTATVTFGGNYVHTARFPDLSVEDYDGEEKKEVDDGPGGDDDDDESMVFWGWVILFLTWALFVITIGSCFGVWSRVWTVTGRTPEDGHDGDRMPKPGLPGLPEDSTLPIDGYYPALLVLSILMSWVWVVFAWLGMKYFRHSKGG